MYNVTELFDLHEVVDIDSLGLAYPVDIVSGKVDKHDVLRSVFVRGKKTGTKNGVLYDTMSAGTSYNSLEEISRTLLGLSSFNSARNSVVVHLSSLNLTQRLWTGTH